MGRPGAGGARPSVRSSGSVHRPATKSSGSVHRVGMSTSRPTTSKPITTSQQKSRPIVNTQSSTPRPKINTQSSYNKRPDFESDFKRDSRPPYKSEPVREERRMPPPPPRREERRMPPPPPPRRVVTQPTIIVTPPQRTVYRDTPRQTTVINNNYGDSKQFIPDSPPSVRRYNNDNTSNNNSGGSGVLLSAFLAILGIVFIVAMLISVSKSKSASAETSLSRTKLDIGIAYMNDCIDDQLGWLNVSKVSKGLKQFYEDTGCQPYILLHANAGIDYTDDEAYEHATRYYDEHFEENQNVVLYAYYEPSDPYELGSMCLIHGTLSGTIMDSEAEEIFWNQLDADWQSYSEMETDEMFIHIFGQTGKSIMYHKTNGWDFLNVLFIMLTVGCVSSAVVIAIKEVNKRQKEKAEETERILKTNLNDLVDEKNQDLLDKYK